jgi:hypothetical protein
VTISGVGSEVFEVIEGYERFTGTLVVQQIEDIDQSVVESLEGL